MGKDLGKAAVRGIHGSVGDVEEEGGGREERERKRARLKTSVGVADKEVLFT